MNCFCFVVVSLFFNTTFHTSDKRDLAQFVHPSVEYRSTQWSLHAVDISAHTSADRYVGRLSVKGKEEKSYALTSTTTKMYCRSH